MIEGGFFTFFPLPGMAVLPLRADGVFSLRSLIVAGDSADTENAGNAGADCTTGNVSFPMSPPFHLRARRPPVCCAVTAVYPHLQ